MTRFTQNPRVSKETELLALDFYSNTIDTFGAEHHRSGRELMIKDAASFKGFMQGLIRNDLK